MILLYLWMEGKFWLMDEKEEVSKYMYIIFYFEDYMELCFLDVWKFGMMEVINKYGEGEMWLIKKFGLELLM